MTLPYRRRSFQAPVRHNKEIFDGVFIAIAAGTTTEVIFAAAVNDYVGAVGTCPISAKIKAVWIEISYTAGSEVPSRFDWLIQKNPIGLAANRATPGATGGQTQRKYILLERKGLNNTVATGSGNNPRAAAGWLMIPKRFQNMAENDELICRLTGTVLHDFCLKFVYKWIA